MLSAREIQNYIADNRETIFRPDLQELSGTTMGTPITVFNHDQEQEYWLVPFLLQSKVRGSAMLTMNGKLITHGVLTPNIHDKQKLIDKNYFEEVPAKLLDEIKNAYPTHDIISHFFSFDQTPQKWGWLVRLQKQKTSNSVNVFVGPNGWYEKQVASGLEG